jgi:hypothetical protein
MYQNMGVGAKVCRYIFSFYIRIDDCEFLLEGVDMSSRILFRAFLFAAVFVFLYSPLQAYTVLWDTSHGTPDSSYIPSASSGEWRYFVQTLNANDFDVTTISEGYSATNLDTADVAVISNVTTVSSAFGSTEITALSSFVANGGGLLVMADTSGTPSNYESIANLFGVSFGSFLTDSSLEITTSNFSEHPVFEGVDEIYMYYAMELLDTGSAMPIAWTPDGEHILATSSVYGKGRVVVLGDSNLWRSNGADDFNKSDNPEFAVKTFVHLVDTDYVPEPATLLLLAAGSWILTRKRKR